MKDIKKISPFHTDVRGDMSYISDGSFAIKDVLIISSKKGTVRANHYHKKDTHIIYLLSGKLEYITRPIKDKKGKITKQIVGPGHVIKTPPYLAHKVRFLEDSLFVVLTTESRKQKNYERDTVRLEVEQTA